jgi:hypothetical protein
MLLVLFELSLIDTILLVQFAESVVLSFFELSNVLKRWTNHLTEAIRLTIPNLALVSTPVFVLITTLTRTFPVDPLSSI